MKLLIVLIASVFFSATSFGQTSVYTLKIDSLGRNKIIDFAAFAGKKILVVNIASGDTSIRQYGEIKQLSQLYKDSLVIVVIPVNNFNTEPGTDQQIASSYSHAAGLNIPIATKLSTAEVAAHPLFVWLTSAAQNGVMNTVIRRPGYKFLINKTGQLRGVFNPRVTPMNATLRNAITSNN
jgi:glutathione peroxidase